MNPEQSEGLKFFLTLDAQSKPFEIIEHTADVGLRIFGRDLKELFVNAAAGLMSFIIDAKSLANQKSIVIDLQEDNREELLVAWLNELLFQFSTHSFLSKEFTIEKISETHIAARLSGEIINPKKHKVISDIKAATYHELTIKETKDGLMAQVILDT